MDEPFAECYRCKSVGHYARNCPERGSGRRGTHPPAAPEGAPEWRGNPIPPRRPDSEISAHPHEWANKARAGLGAFTHCGDPADRYTSPFRRDEGLAPIHLCQLRQIAAAQLDERNAA